MQEFLTTNEVAKLLRIKERKVYDLASSGVLPCSKAIGKLLFPRDQIDAWIASNSENVLPASPKRPLVFLGSHDPVLEWALRESQCGLAMLFDGSNDGLNRFSNYEGIATGLHIRNESNNGWNTEAVSSTCANSPVVLFEWAKRQRGLMLSSNAAKNVQSVEDIAGLRVVPRQTEAGAQHLLLQLIHESALTPDSVKFTETVRTEIDVADAIKNDQADVGLGLQSVAESFNLAFLPLIEERFDILVDRRSYFEDPMQRLLMFCNSSKFTNRTTSISGNDCSQLGTVHFIGA